MTTFSLLRMQVGGHVAAEGLTLALDPRDGRLTLREATGLGAPREVRVPALGLEDVLLTKNLRTSPSVEVLLRVRAVDVTGPAWRDVSAVRGRSLVVVVEVDAATALSLLFCLCSLWVRSAETLTTHLAPGGGVDGGAERQRNVATLCSALRKGLARRDLLNRGWSDEQLLADGRVSQLLLQETPAWREKHRFPARPCLLAIDAPQLRHHDTEQQARRAMRADDTPVESAPPTVTAAPVRKRESSLSEPSRTPPAPSAIKLELVSGSSPSLSAGPLDDEEARKPKTAYQMFHMHQVAQLKRDDPTIKHQAAFRKAALIWSQLSTAEQEEWGGVCDIHPALQRERKKKKRARGSNADPYKLPPDEDFLL